MTQPLNALIVKQGDGRQEVEQLLAASGTENFSEVRRLEAEIRDTQEAVG